MTGADLNFDFLINIAIQLPLLVLFIWYNDRMLRRFDDVQDRRDRLFVQSIQDVSEKITIHDEHVERRIQTITDNALRRRTGDHE